MEGEKKSAGRSPAANGPQTSSPPNCCRRRQENLHVGLFKKGAIPMIGTHHFRFGVICERMQSADEWVAKARYAESVGYSTFLIRDHFIREPFGDQFAPMIAS